MKLLLTSAGLSNEIIIDEFKKLLGKPLNETKMIFIPTAADAETDKSYVEKDKKIFNELGIQVTYLELDYKIEYDEVKDYDVIFVEGGNTFYLLSKIRESGLESIVKQFLEDGKIYFGVSAGTYVACPTIEHAHWAHADADVAGLDNLTAMNLIPFLLTAHYEPSIENETKEEVSKTKYETRILTDQQAIVVTDKVRFIGNGEEVKL